MPQQTVQPSVSRRSVAAGIAWAVPTVTLVTAVPAVAASASCPELLDPDGWEIAKPATGRMRHNDDDGFHKMANGTGVAYYIVGDSGNSEDTTVTLTQSIDVVAGTTYTFSFYVLFNGGTYGVNRANRVNGTFYVDGEELWTDNTTTAGGIPKTDDGKRAYASSTMGDLITVHFTATETGSIPVVIEWWLKGTYGASVNDDLAITLPTVACSNV